MQQASKRCQKCNEGYYLRTETFVTECIHPTDHCSNYDPMQHKCIQCNEHYLHLSGSFCAENPNRYFYYYLGAFLFVLLSTVGAIVWVVVTHKRQFGSHHRKDRRKNTQNDGGREVGKKDTFRLGEQGREEEEAGQTPSPGPTVQPFANRVEASKLDPRDIQPKEKSKTPTELSDSKINESRDPNKDVKKLETVEKAKMMFIAPVKNRRSSTDNRAINESGGAEFENLTRRKEEVTINNKLE